MRRLTAWLSGAAGGIALYRLLARRPAPALPPAPAAGPDPRAEELRAKLEQHEVAAPEPEPEAPAPAEPEDPDERRRHVHERARAAADEMRRTQDS